MNGFGDVPHLGLGGPQKLVPHGSIEKELANFDRRARRDSHWVESARHVRRRFRVPPLPRNRQADCELASGSPRQSKPVLRREIPASPRETDRRRRQSCWWHDWPRPATIRRPQSRSRCRSTRISSAPPFSIATSIRVAPASSEFSTQFLHDARGPFDHLAGGNLVDDAVARVGECGHGFLQTAAG